VSLPELWRLLRFRDRLIVGIFAAAWALQQAMWILLAVRWLFR